MRQVATTRERIVRTAARLFLTRSFESVGVSELCAAAKVHKGSFYYYFPSKAELVKAVIEHHAGGLEATLARHRTGSPLDELRGVAETVGAIQDGFEARFGRVVGCPFGNLAAEVSTTEEDVREHLAELFRRWEELIARSCRRAWRAGLLRADPERLAHMILAHTQGSILLAKTSGAPASDIRAALHEVINAHLVEAPGRVAGNTAAHNAAARVTESAAASAEERATYAGT